MNPIQKSYCRWLSVFAYVTILSILTVAIILNHVHDIQHWEVLTSTN